jgi:Ca2+-binding EF-hand superfamily protein
VLASLGEFQEKELHSIKSFFDIDNNGSIDEDEFMSQLKKADKSYESYLQKKAVGF